VIETRQNLFSVLKKSRVYGVHKFCGTPSAFAQSSISLHNRAFFVYQIKRNQNQGISAGGNVELHRWKRSKRSLKRFEARRLEGVGIIYRTQMAGQASFDLKPRFRHFA